MKLRLFGFTLGLLIFSFIVFKMTKNYSFYNSQRDPAAVRGVDISHLKGNALEYAIKEKLLTSIKVQQNKEGIGIQLGSFYMMNENGAKVSTCQNYRQFSLYFEAEGIATSGERPSMELISGCTMEKANGMIDPLWLPVARITAQNPFEGDFQDHQNKSVLVRFRNTPDYWPQMWILSKMTVTDQNGQSVVISREDISKIFGHPYAIEW